jgi:hypothetical protein
MVDDTALEQFTFGFLLIPPCWPSFHCCPVQIYHRHTSYVIRQRIITSAIFNYVRGFTSDTSVGWSQSTQVSLYRASDEHCACGAPGTPEGSAFLLITELEAFPGYTRGSIRSDIGHITGAVMRVLGKPHYAGHFPSGPWLVRPVRWPCTPVSPPPNSSWTT